MNILHDIKYNFLQIFNNLAGPLDRLFIKNKEYSPKKIKPIFIIGPPRSGTTLLYQILINNFDLSYINNFIGSFYKIPITAAKVYNLFNLNTNNVRYISKHGNTKGINGPNEFGNFWYRWFPRNPQFATENTLSLNEKNDILQNLAELENTLGKPIVFKNVVNTVRIGALKNIFPNSVFLISRRNPVYNIQSIYKIRKKLNKNKDEWWSVKPLEYNKIKNLSLLKQCVYQVYYLEKYTDNFIQNQNSNQFKIVQYESLCSKTEKTLFQIDKLFQKNDMDLDSNCFSNEKLENRNRQQLDDDKFKKIQQQVNRLWERV